MKNKRELHFVCADCCISIPTIDADGELETLEEGSFMLHPHTVRGEVKYLLFNFFYPIFDDNYRLYNLRWAINLLLLYVRIALSKNDNIISLLIMILIYCFSPAFRKLTPI